MLDAIAANGRRVLPPLMLAGIVVVLLLVWYGATLNEILTVWNGSETYQHGYAVLPLCLWLLWRQRRHILAADFAPAWGAAVPLALAGLAWLVGELAAVGTIKHFALVGLLLSAVWLVWGSRAAWAAAFPLGFLFFAVPFGEFLVPTLMQYTADFTVAALRVSGLPVYREGLSFIIPSGTWSVVEACSGIRYLIASVMVGTLYAFLTYTSLHRRLAFVAVSFVVPLAANWLRAYMIVMLGHLSGNKLAVGVDHLIYGWVFFGVVIFAMFWIGGRWREDPDPATQPTGIGAVVAPSRFVAAGAMALLLGGLWLPLTQWLLSVPDPRLAALQAPAGKAGWQRVDSGAEQWSPLYSGAAQSLSQTYAKDGASVRLITYAYAGQRNGRKLLQWDNRLVADEGKRTWEVVEEQRTGLETPMGRLPAVQVRLKGLGYVDAWYWFVVDGQTTVSAREAKWSLLKDRLLRRSDYSAAVFVITDGSDGRGAARVQDFLRGNADDIAAMLAAAEQ